jgi:hypothetical protein
LISQENSIKTRILIFLGASGVFIEPAFAYIDPGVGSMLLQGLIASAIGFWLVIKLYWARIISFLERVFRKSVSPDSKK